MNTKRIFSIISVTLITFTTATAQRISVVTEDGATSVFRTLQQAIEGADPGSTIYLPGGGFSIADSVKITKRLTIIGIGHKSDNENADGFTYINGNVFFNEGSCNSSIMACYLSGSVNVGDDDITIRYCNFNTVNVYSNCDGALIDQNYIRGYPCSFGTATGVVVQNNIMQGISTMTGGLVKNNILVSGGYMPYSSVVGNITFNDVHNTTITNNILLSTGYVEPNNSNNGKTPNSGLIVTGNMRKGAWGEGCINMGDTDWNDVFDNYNGGAISPSSSFHFKEAYAEYEHQVGIYAGDSFNEDQTAPVPYIVSKSIPQQTDATGKLNIKVRVKAGE